jgi:nitroreductase
MNKLVELIKQTLTPNQKMVMKSILEVFLIVPNSFVDMLRFITKSGTFRSQDSKNKSRALLIKNYHVIEKGLSLPNPRVNFGKSLLVRTVFLTEMYVEKFGADEAACHAYSAIKSYVDFHQVHGSYFEDLEFFLEKNKTMLCSENEVSGGVRSVTGEHLIQMSKGNFKSLTEARCSVRHFSEKKIETSDIENTINIIRRTPSVCNRPTTKIYAYSDNKRKKEILLLQNGNRGFGHMASHVFIVTADLNSFNGSKERNQPFVDGGLTAMSLIYALQSQGIGTCFLNWSVNISQDKKLKKVTGIPETSVIITLIAAGHFPKDFLVTQSPKVNRNSFFELIDD